jgi:hypothetical protein
MTRWRVPWPRLAPSPPPKTRALHDAVRPLGLRLLNGLSLLFWVQVSGVERAVIMKLTLRKDTANRIAARLLVEASRLELNHRTPVAGEKFTMRPVTIDREIARLRRWANQLRRAIV